MNLFDQFDGTLAPPEVEEEALEGGGFDQFDPAAMAQAAAAQEREVPVGDIGQGIVQGGLDTAQASLDALAGDRSQPPEGISDMIAQIPGAAINLMTGGQGGEFLKRLDLGQYGPGTPPSPEGQLGHDLAPVAVPFGGLAAVKGAGAIRKHMKGDPSEAALAASLQKPGQPREAYEDAITGETPPATKAEAQAKFKEMKESPDYHDEVMSPMDVDSVMGSGRGQLQYRAKVQDLLSERGDLISMKHQRAMMAVDEGMTVAQYAKLRRQIGVRTKPPKNAAMEEPLAAQRRGAYSAAARALDEMEMPPANVAAKLYGEGSNIWAAAKNYQRARATVSKHVKIGPDGERAFNSKTFQNELDAMDPARVGELFGSDMRRIINAAKKVTYRGYKARQKQKAKSQRSVTKLLRDVALITGVTYASNKLMREGGRQVFGMKESRPGKGGR